MSYNDYYDETAFIGATVLTHPMAKEKEQLSGTAFAHIQEEEVVGPSTFPGSTYCAVVVTVLLIKDIVRVAEAARKIKSSCLGCACLCW